MATMQAHWDPGKTRVFAVGILQYKDKVHWPLEGRRDAVLIEVLKERGVPEANIVFLKDLEATQKVLQKALKEHLQASSEGELLLVYFAGHGTRNGRGGGAFNVIDGDWLISDLIASIEQYFRGDAALLTADCCFSGTLAVEALHRAGRVAFATLSSALAISSSTSTWTFTDSLIHGLEGRRAIDEEGAGEVRLDALARYTEKRMASITGQLSCFAVTNGFPASLSLGKTRPTKEERIGTLVEGLDDEGGWYRALILGTKGDKVRVHWIGFEDSLDQWIETSRIRPWKSVDYKLGAKIQGQSKGVWYKATVLARRSDLYLLRWDDYADYHDEWLPSSLIKARRAG